MIITYTISILFQGFMQALILSVHRISARLKNAIKILEK